MRSEMTEIVGGEIALEYVSVCREKGADYTL